MTSVTKNQTDAPKTTKTVTVGRAWINDKASLENRQPALTTMFDRRLKSTLSFVATDRIAFFPNNKREGHRDADFLMAIQLPIAQADAIIAELNKNYSAPEESNGKVLTAVESLRLSTPQ